MRPHWHRARPLTHTNFLERWLTALRSAGDHDSEATRHAGGPRARRGEDAVLHVRADAQAHAEADAVAHDGADDRPDGDADAGADAEADDAHSHSYADDYADERPDGDPIICPDIYAHVGADWRADRCTQLHPHSDSHERAYGDAYCIAVLRTDGRAVAVAVEAADPGIAAHVRADAVALRDALGDAHGRAELRAHWRADVIAVGDAFVGAELHADVAALGTTLGGARQLAHIHSHEHSDAAAELQTDAASLIPADAAARQLRAGRQHVHADVGADVRADEGPGLSANLRPDARADHSQLQADGGTALIKKWHRCVGDCSIVKYLLVISSHTQPQDSKSRPPSMRLLELVEAIQQLREGRAVLGQRLVREADQAAQERL